MSIDQPIKIKRAVSFKEIVARAAKISNTQAKNLLRGRAIIFNGIIVTDLSYLAICEKGLYLLTLDFHLPKEIKILNFEVKNV